MSKADTKFPKQTKQPRSRPTKPMCYVVTAAPANKCFGGRRRRRRQIPTPLPTWKRGPSVRPLLETTRTPTSRVGSLPPLKVVAAEGVVGIDGEAEWTRVKIGIRILDIKVVLGV